MRKQSILVWAMVVLFLGVTANAVDITFTDDGVIQEGDYYDNVWVYDTSPNTTTIEMTGGSVGHLYTYDQSATNVSGGLLGSLTTYEESTVNFSGQTYDWQLGGNNIFSYGKSTINMNGGGGTQRMAFHCYDQSTINFTQCGEPASFYGYGYSTINLMGFLFEHVVVSEESTVNVSGGHQYGADMFYSYDQSEVNISGGTIEWLRSYDQSLVDISGGTIEWLYSYDQSLVDISGGYVEDLYPDNNSIISLTGGEVLMLFARNSTEVQMSGGTIRGLLGATDSSVIHIYGFDFNSDPNGGDQGNGWVIGFWPDGMPFSIDLHNIGTDSTYDHVVLHEVPGIHGYIDWFDFAALAGRWLEDGCSDANYWCSRADINRSGNVDFTDYAFLGQYWQAIAPEPNAATDPDPNDMAFNVSITADLSWTAGSDTASHDVYFSTDFNDVNDGDSNALTICGINNYDPGTMDASTIYYWRIDEVGLGVTTIGEVWSFTTASAPGQASNPNPTDTETNVSITTDLSWTAGSDTTSHDVYFGTNPTPDVNEFRGNQSATIFDPGVLEYETTYYWRIDEIGLGGTVTGAVWSFTTIIDPNLVSRWKFNEVSGNIAYDSSGNENHGQLIDGLDNGLVWVPAESSLNFDGSNNLSRVLIPTTGMTTTAGTIAIWANLAEPQERGGGRNGQAYFFGCDNGGINKILLYMSNSDTQLDVKVGNRSNNNIITLSTETWYHIALTWNAGTYAVYVNGSPLDSGTYSGLSSLPSTADIGNNGNSSTQSLHGLIDEVMIFHKSLSAEEIQQLYQDGPS